MSERFLKIVGHLTFLVLIILALVYAPERTSFVDSAWQFFARVNTESFVYPESRYGVIISEIPLFLAIKLGVPFEILVYIFSVSYILLYYLVWWLCVYTLKNPVSGLALLFWLCIGMNFSFVHIVTESHQAIAYSILLFALLDNKTGIRQKFLFPLLAGVAVLALFCHPFAFFTLAFIAVWPVIKDGNYRNSGSWLIISIALLITLSRFYFFHGSYDAQHYERLKSMPIADILTKGSYPLQFYGLVLREQYILSTIVILFTVGLLLVHKNRRLLTGMLVSVILYMGVMSVGLHNGDSHIMMERVYLPAFLMVYLVLGEQLCTPGFRFIRTMYFLIPLALLAGMYQLNQGGIVYRKRAEYLCELMQLGQQISGTEQDKFFITQTEADSAKIQIFWSLGTETLVLSRFHLGQNITLAVSDSLPPCDDDYYMPSNTSFVPISYLNAKYFSLSKRRYVHIAK